MIGNSLAVAIIVGSSSIGSEISGSAIESLEIQTEPVLDEVLQLEEPSYRFEDCLPTQADIEHFRRTRLVAIKLVERGDNVINGFPMQVDALTRTLCSRIAPSKSWSLVKLYAVQGVVRCESGVYEA